MLSGIHFYFFLASGLLLYYHMPKKYILSPQGLFNSLDYLPDLNVSKQAFNMEVGKGPSEDKNLPDIHVPNGLLCSFGSLKEHRGFSMYPKCLGLSLQGHPLKRAPIYGNSHLGRGRQRRRRCRASRLGHILGRRLSRVMGGVNQLGGINELWNH